MLAMMVIGASVVWTIGRRVSRLYKTQDWLIDVIRTQGERMAAIDANVRPDMSKDVFQIASDHRWPWGSHHTQYLGYLEAAARKWWVLYDPSDPTTAPTNEMVSDWLRKEHNLSKEKARSIASMLRPDGLPTGPRQ
jgi:hypothetical protein